MWRLDDLPIAKNEGVVDEVDAVRVYKFREGALTFTDVAAPNTRNLSSYFLIITYG